MKFFAPPISDTKFYELVNSGKVVQIKGVKKYYALNESLKRLGLREVERPLIFESKRPLEEIARLAFWIIDPDHFLEPSWASEEHELNENETRIAAEIIETHESNLLSFENPALRIQYAQGVIDASRLTKWKFGQIQSPPQTE